LSPAVALQEREENKVPTSSATFEAFNEE